MHEAITEATVISAEHKRWQERPVAYVNTNKQVSEAEIRDHLLESVPKWWLADLFVFSEDILRMSTGKYDKKAIRATFEREYSILPLDDSRDSRRSSEQN